MNTSLCDVPRSVCGVCMCVSVNQHVNVPVSVFLFVCVCEHGDNGFTKILSQSQKNFPFPSAYHLTFSFPLHGSLPVSFLFPSLISLNPLTYLNSGTYICHLII